MLSQLHEVLVAMVRENDDLARAIAHWATGRPLPADVKLRTRDQSYSEVKPPEYRADLVLEFVPQGAESPTSMMILEVQLSHDSKKRHTWPAYQAVLRAQYRCPTMLVVLAPNPTVARWCAQPIDLDGQGGLHRRVPPSSAPTSCRSSSTRRRPSAYPRSPSSPSSRTARPPTPSTSVAPRATRHRHPRRVRRHAVR